jgi:hypothetical protein
MSIKFICSCGKHLRARDEMAARRSMCPRCGAPVGIPSLRPTHPGTPAAPLTPQERIRLNRNKPSVETASGAALALREKSTLGTLTGPRSPDDEPSPTPKVRRRRQLEQHWYQCLAYPLLSRNVLVCFALILSVGMGGIVLTIQNFPSFSPTTLSNWFPWVSSLVFVVMIAAYAYSTVECALTSALEGKGAASYLPSWSAADPLKSGMRWLFCFFAGPIVPVGLVVYFWLYGGDLTAIDWAIMTELGIVAAGYWFLVVICANLRNRLRDANPRCVVQLVQHLKYRAIVPILIAPTLALAHVLFGLFTLSLLHEHMFAGWLLLTGCLCSALFWSAFLFRLLGVWCYYTKP